MLTLDAAGRRVGDRWLWRRLSFALEPGESLGLAGPSGSGKTLLLRALVGLDRLDEGEVRLDGRSLAEWKLPRYRCRVLYLPPSPPLEEGTVEANLRLPFTFRVRRPEGFDRQGYDRERARTLLERLGVGELLDCATGDLSSGERQRVGFARALLVEPRVLLLDEPTAHVDPERTSVMEAMVKEWRGEGERAAVWTSHDAAQLARMTGRRIDLRDFQGDP